VAATWRGCCAAGAGGAPADIRLRAADAAHAGRLGAVPGGDHQCAARLSRAGWLAPCLRKLAEDAEAARIQEVTPCASALRSDRHPGGGRQQSGCRGPGVAREARRAPRPAHRDARVAV
jgi:hypothetical protein